MDLNSDSSAYLLNGKIHKATRFLVSYKVDSAREYAKEWFKAAAISGYKPAVFELVELCDAHGEAQEAFDWLQCLMKPPPTGKKEQWPQLVVKAKTRLAGLRKTTSPPT